MGCHYSIIDNELYVNGRKYRHDIIDRVSFSPQYVKVVTMCIHVSTKCNLKCRYCFRKENNNESININDIKRFIDCVLQVYPRADRYNVDMSGDAEPLLNPNLVFSIAQYCKQLSDRLNRSVIPLLVTNGTLLSENIVHKLQDAGILFGISLDGDIVSHDKNRVFPDGRGSFNLIKQNISNINNKKYVGAAITYSGGDLLNDFLVAFDLLPTVSIKPTRFTNEDFDVDLICKGYKRLIEFILIKTLENKTDYLFSLINGDDYFGKFLKRIVLRSAVYGRCDAGIGRFSLASDKKIYFCPPAVGIPDGCLGDLDNGIPYKEIVNMWGRQQNSLCSKCFAYSACGGECKIVSYNLYGNFDNIDNKMCYIKRYLFALAVCFITVLRQKDVTLYKWLKKAVQQIDSYDALDIQLAEAVQKCQGEYSYTQLKYIKDNNSSLFDKIYTSLTNKKR